MNDEDSSNGSHTSDMTPAQVILLYREAIGRAQNIAHDLDDFEWIDSSPASASKQLGEILDEASDLEQALRKIVAATREGRRGNVNEAIAEAP